jgi:cytochrome P450
LARHPDEAEKVFQEVSLVDNINDIQQLRKLRHLSAVISETMRLYPALLAGGSRKTGSNGVTIAGRYIPPHTTIINPRYTIG